MNTELTLIIDENVLYAVVDCPKCKFRFKDNCLGDEIENNKSRESEGGIQFRCDYCKTALVTVKDQSGLTVAIDESED